jgi:hypothetical protein
MLLLSRSESRLGEGHQGEASRAMSKVRFAFTGAYLGPKHRFRVSWSLVENGAISSILNQPSNKSQNTAFACCFTGGFTPTARPEFDDPRLQRSQVKFVTA